MFITPTLLVGGAEQIFVDLVSNLNREEFKISCVVLGTQETSRLHVPSDIPIIYLQRRSRLSIPLVILRLRKLLARQQPDLAIATTWSANVYTIAAQRTLFPQPLVALWEHITPSEFFGDTGPVGRLKLTLLKYSYPYADLIVAASDGIRDELIERFGIDGSKILRIHNSVDLERVRLGAKQPLRHPWANDEGPLFVSVGRLEPQKDFSTLIKGFARVAGSSWKLIIVGEGTERPLLEQLVSSLGLKDNCQLVGEVSNPFPYMKAATAFVLTSRFEGFGIVLVEAMALGIPVIATDCSHGPREIIQDECGVLVPVGDVDTLASALLSATQGKRFRDRFSDRAKERAEFFSTARMVPKFERAVTSLLSRRT